MVSTHDDTQHSVAWRLRDQEAFTRRLERTFGLFPDRERWLTQVLECFSQRLQGHPREWPTANAAPTDHSFRFFGIDIRYRVFPDDETVEVTSVTSILPPGRHPDATRTI
jgi:hypothetical protein